MIQLWLTNSPDAEIQSLLQIARRSRLLLRRVRI